MSVQIGSGGDDPGGMLGRHRTAGLTDVGAVQARAFWDAGGSHLRRSVAPGDERGCTVSCERRRLARNALIKLEVGLGLFEKVPVRPASILPGRQSAGGSARRLQQSGSQPSQSPLWVALRPSWFASSMSALGRDLPPRVNRPSVRKQASSGPWWISMPLAGVV